MGKTSSIKLSKRIADARPLATTAMHSRVEELRLAGKSVIDFSIAISHFDAPLHVRTEVATAAMNTKLPYTSVAGAHALRARLSMKVRRENGIDAKANEIIVTNGAKQALYEALYVLTDPGDTVIVLRPYWPAYLATANLLGVNVRLVDLPANLDVEFLNGLPAAKLIILNNPHNPTGRVCSASELQLLLKWMRENNCGAIVDESYEKLVYEGQHFSLASDLDWRDLNIVTIFSASQSYAMMGWRVGFAVAEAEVVRAMEALQGPITAAVSSLTQVAAGAAFDFNNPHELTADYRSRRQIVATLFGAIPWMRIAPTNSGPYMWCDIRSLECDTVAFAEELLFSRQVAVMPGDALGCPGFIRIGFISDDEATLRAGLAAIKSFGDSMAQKLVLTHTGTT